MLVFAEQVLKKCILGVLLSSVEHDKLLYNHDVGPLADYVLQCELLEIYVYISFFVLVQMSDQTY